ncbi:MAG: hypothetical protein ACRDTH_29675 [Pseudonocardiaceae bacterium]
MALTPGFLRSEAVLDHFGVTEPTWRDAIATDPHLVASETRPTSVARSSRSLLTPTSESGPAGAVHGEAGPGVRVHRR